MTSRTTDESASSQLVRHLISAQIDNPDHIYLISPGTQSYALLLRAAEELDGKPAADIEAQIEERRAAIEEYRPLVAEVERLREELARYERALNEIAHEHPAEPGEVARRALGGEG